MRVRYICKECGIEFDADKAKRRDAVTVDHKPEWVSIDICPHCGSEQLDSILILDYSESQVEKAAQALTWFAQQLPGWFDVPLGSEEAFIDAVIERI